MKTETNSKSPVRIRNYRKKAGLPPGSLVYTGNIEQETTFDLFSYSENRIERYESASASEIISHIETGSNNWINIIGLNNTDLISQIGEHHEIHPLLLEDVLNTDSVPKIENYGDVLYISLKMLQWDHSRDSIDAEQISFILGTGYLLSFQEKSGDVFDSVRERLLNGLSKARGKSIDFLAYVLIDKIVDNYFLILEKIEDTIENTELELIRDTDLVTPLDLMHLKKQLILLRKHVYPIRDEVRKLQRDDSNLIDRKTIKYFNDIYDHLQNIIQNLESFRDSITNLMELYSSTVSNKLNEVMKTLTIVGAIFIPLTFIVGVYGMNFQYMPELHYRWSYPLALAVMVLIAVGMYLFMKSRKWF